MDKFFILRDLPDPDGVDGEVFVDLLSRWEKGLFADSEEGGSFEERQTALRTTRSKKRQELFVRRVKDRYGPSVVRSVVPSQWLFKQRIRPVAEDGSDWDGNASVMPEPPLLFDAASGPSDLGTLMLFLLLDMTCPLC